MEGRSLVMTQVKTLVVWALLLLVLLAVAAPALAMAPPPPHSAIAVTAAAAAPSPVVHAMAALLKQIRISWILLFVLGLLLMAYEILAFLSDIGEASEGDIFELYEAYEGAKSIYNLGKWLVADYHAHLDACIDLWKSLPFVTYTAYKP
jgi:hypothetical protein